MFENLGENLTKKLGPFPVWVWGMLIGGAVIAWYWYSGFGITEPANSGSDPEFTTDQLPPSGDFSERVVVPEGDSGVDQATNLEWLNQAVKAAGVGGASIVAVQRAIEKYLTSQSLTPEEQGYVDRAIAAVGLPPEGTSGVGELESPDQQVDSKATVTTVETPLKGRYGRPFTQRVKVRWADRGGRTSNPGGKVIIYRNGKRVGTIPVLNGNAFSVFIPRKSSATGDRITFGARFLPARPSQASPSSATGTIAAFG